MPTVARGDYEFPPLDAEENFGGAIVVYWNWLDHQMFPAPIALPLDPAMPFRAVLDEVMPGAYGAHPQYAEIDWTKAEWTLDGRPFTPDPGAGLKANGIRHKSVLRFRTPGLDGLYGATF